MSENLSKLEKVTLELFKQTKAHESDKPEYIEEMLDHCVDTAARLLNKCADREAARTTWTCTTNREEGKV